MDLLSIAQTTWRHKLLVLPVILLTLAGAVYVLKIKAPVYQASSSFLLINSPGPTNAQIAAHPELQKMSPNNPYLNSGNSVVADVVINLVTGPAAQRTLIKEGADPRYQIAPSPLYGSPPILDILGIGASPQEAIRTSNLVLNEAVAELYKMQKSQGANDMYLIKPIVLTRASSAQSTVSGKLRTLITVLALGALMVFVVISAAQAIEKRRAVGSSDDNLTLRAQLRNRTGLEHPRQEDGAPWVARTAPFRPSTKARAGGG